MERMSLWNKLTARMKANKKLEIGVYIGIALLVALLYFTGFQSDNAREGKEAPKAVAPAERGDEKRLQEALTLIQGAGKVEVMLTYENGKELVPAYSTDTQSSLEEGGSTQSESTRPVTVSKGGQEEAIVLKEVEPSIRGVIVIAEGADDIKVRMDLLRAASKALGVPVEKVEVFTMEKREKAD